MHPAVPAKDAGVIMESSHLPLTSTPSASPVTLCTRVTPAAITDGPHISGAYTMKVQNSCSWWGGSLAMCHSSTQAPSTLGLHPLPKTLGFCIQPAGGEEVEHSVWEGFELQAWKCHRSLCPHSMGCSCTVQERLGTVASCVPCPASAAQHLQGPSLGQATLPCIWATAVS